MAKLAQKRPDVLKTVVQLNRTEAEVWYAHPVCIGKIEYRDGYWFCADGQRCVSARDAMHHLIQILYRQESPLVQATAPSPRAPGPQKEGQPSVVPALRPSLQEAKKPAGPRWKVAKKKGDKRAKPLEFHPQDKFLGELFDYIREHPEMQSVLRQGAKKEG